MFNVSLELPSGNKASHWQADLSVQDYSSLVMEACELLGRTNCRFHMGGFGQDDWKLDVAYDMSTVVEQLPDILTALRSSGDVELDLYAQGLERRISFTVDGAFIDARCQSSTSWVPPTPVERLERSHVVTMFEALAVDFARAVAVVSPHMAETAPFGRWKEGDV